MRPDVVVDVGNTRIKWGLCNGPGTKGKAWEGFPDSSRLGAIDLVASLPPDDPQAWEARINLWGLQLSRTWVLTGVHPARLKTLRTWLKDRGEQVMVLKDPQKLPLKIALARPERVGIDRLLNAVAALTNRCANQPVAIVDAGSAVTVDWVNAAGAFCGGTIIPGLRLMAEALHSFTALLPLVEISNPEPPLPGVDTRSAMEAGIFWTLVGGVNLLIDRLARLEQTEPCVFLTGGDGPRLSPFISRAHTVWPEMTLEGVRLAAESIS